MKISFILDQNEFVQAVMEYDRTILRAAIVAWLSKRGHTITAEDVIALNPDGTVIVSETVLAVPAPETAIPGVLVPPVVQTTTPPVPSAQNSITCVATIFGLNYDGSIDPEDNGQGAFTDHATGKPYDTRNKSLVGCAIPPQILWPTIGVRDKDSISKREFVAIVTSQKTGKQVTAPIVDLGPGQGGNLLRNPDRFFDCTYGLAQALGHTDNAEVVYQIFGNSGPLAIKGLPITVIGS